MQTFVVTKAHKNKGIDPFNARTAMLLTYVAAIYANMDLYEWYRRSRNFRDTPSSLVFFSWSTGSDGPVRSKMHVAAADHNYVLWICIFCVGAQSRKPWSR